MKIVLHRGISVGFSVAVLGAITALLGCEEGQSTTELIIEPSEVTLGEGVYAVTFTVDSNCVKELGFPLEWQVTRPELGRISASAGYSAVYERTDLPGVNVIIVNDQYNGEGLATVHQGVIEAGEEEE